MRLCLRCDERSQSEVVGIILLIAVVVTLVIGAGAVIFADWQSQGDRETRANVGSDLTTTNLTLQHMGGDTLEPEDVLVVLQGVDTEITLDDEQFDSSADRFEPGSSWEYWGFSSTLDGVITLRVFHTPSNTLLHEETYEVGQDGLRLTIDDERSPQLLEGETVPYSVEKLFERAEPMDVTDSTTVDVEPGSDGDLEFHEDDTVTATDAGELIVNATYEDQSDEITVIVEEARPFFEVDIDEEASTLDVVHGEAVSVHATVENTGTLEETKEQDIDIEVVGSDENDVVFEDSASIELAVDETDDVIFEWDTQQGDVGDYDANVSSDDDWETESVTVGGTHASDLLLIFEGEKPVSEDETFTQHLTWENPGEETVTLVTHGLGTEPTATTIEVDPGEVITPETLGFPEQGTVLNVEDDEDANEVTVEIGPAGPSNILEITADSDPVAEGETFDQHLTWKNMGEETVTLVVHGDGTEPTTTTIEIEPGEGVTPETLGFLEEGVFVAVVDDFDENEVTVEIGEA